MPDARQHPHRRRSRIDHGPAPACRLFAEHSVRNAVSWIGFAFPVIDFPAACAARFEGRWWSLDSLSPLEAKPPSLDPAPFVALEPAQKCRRLERRLGDAHTLERHLNRPKRTLHAFQVTFVRYVFMAQEFCPCAGRRVGEVLYRTFAVAMPSGCRLIRCFPKKRKAPVAVAKQDHVAPAPVSDAASARTRRVPSASGLQPCLSMAAGERPPTCARGRSNQRRIPNSL